MTSNIVYSKIFFDLSSGRLGSFSPHQEVSAANRRLYRLRAMVSIRLIYLSEHYLTVMQEQSIPHLRYGYSEMLILPLSGLR